jgi:hypothetical protein
MGAEEVPPRAAADDYEVVLVPRSRPKQAWSWLLSLVAGAFTLGAWAPSLDVERARIVRRSDGRRLREVDNVGASVGQDLVREAAADVATMSADSFASKWVPS